jgi:hypothetical protein
MKPLPNINDATLMAKLGQSSALYSARKDAIAVLRDAYTGMQATGAEWDEIAAHARVASAAAERLVTLATMWQELKA